VSVQDGPWHFLVCTGLSNGELSYRRDAVVKAIAHVARMVGAQVREEVTGLDAKSAQRTSGGTASHAVRLAKAIGEEGERWSAGTWTSSAIERQLLGAIAQRYSAAMLWPC
jgi:hypothetical protein